MWWLYFAMYLATAIFWGGLFSRVFADHTGEEEPYHFLMGLVWPIILVSMLVFALIIGIFNAGKSLGRFLE